jgi:hypothetical protein
VPDFLWHWQQRAMLQIQFEDGSDLMMTQEFNTTTSIGRLTLNILLSFAQFERELIGERTRDKLGAARRKGKWIGGIPVLGYDVAPKGGSLVVNAKEARRVREIFAIAAKAETLSEALEQVNARGLTTKQLSFPLSDRLKKPFSFSLQRRPGRTSPPPPEAETVRPLMSCEPPQCSHVLLGIDSYSP